MHSYRLKTKANLYFVTPFLIIALLTFKGKLNAQELITDRPDVTESAVTVPLGDFQIENGFLFESQSLENNSIINDIHNYTISSALFRLGVLNKFELRLGGDYLHQITKLKDNKTEISGFNNLLIGSKLQFTNEKLNGQDLGILLQFYLPIEYK